MPQLLAEVERFRSWAAAYPGEWEDAYDDWNLLHAAVLEFVDQKPFVSWSLEELAAVTYAVARDNEIQYLSREIRERHPIVLIYLAKASLRSEESDAKWQFAEELGRMKNTTSSRREELLLLLAHDADEYVRRRSLGALARIGSAATEQIALEAWSRPDESQQWARMMALWALHRVGSAHLNELLNEAESDERPHLHSYAAKVRRGEVEP